MSLAERIQLLVAALPPHGAVTLTRDDLAEMLAADGATRPSAISPLEVPAADLTVAQVAELFHRGESTVRTWLGEQRFPGAYRLRGREWRIPRADLEAMQRAEAAGFRQQKQPPKPAETPVSLSAWRQHLSGPR